MKLEHDSNESRTNGPTPVGSATADIYIVYVCMVRYRHLTTYLGSYLELSYVPPSSYKLCAVALSRTYGNYIVEVYVMVWMHGCMYACMVLAEDRPTDRPSGRPDIATVPLVS